jgi:hypothetical protein
MSAGGVGPDLRVADVTSHGDFSPEARAHAERTVEVAAIFADSAELIVARLDDVPAGHVLVAVVDLDNRVSGMHHVEQTDLVERVPQLEATEGRSMVFSPGSSVADVRRRTDDMAATARRRAEVIDRIAARRGT